MMAALALWLGRAWGKVQGWAIVALALLAAVGAVFLKGRREGREHAQAQAQADNARRDIAARDETIQAGQERADVENDIAGRPAGDARQRLHDDWSRD
ncbi:hypothetical protein [Orrella dioscoreae]|uniref:Uncharacterized protein n=1 Tax=Orrella dioscoreae TaxID=1851544 RepID=A0A1C3K1F0_9BURK|nr:hypothetical protein [Orrella dioscoreae]SBT25340.1 hypothetical protein ODI_03643 [Orrella dioscoreae]SOE49141.1 hypothetical protein ODI_R1866 [Orrella dioscoreae]